MVIPHRDHTRESKTIVLPSVLIPVKGFGEENENVERNGIIKMIKTILSYRMKCGCIISSENLCGESCIYCYAEDEIASQKNNGNSSHTFTDQMKQFRACSCVNHTFTCSSCMRPVCFRHAIPFHDGANLCPDHYEALNEQLIQLTNPISYRARRFIKGLF